MFAISRRRTRYAFLGILVGHVVLISAQINTPSGMPALEAVTFNILSRSGRLVATAVGGCRSLWRDYIDLRGARQENSALKAELADLGVRLQRQAEQAQSAERLRQLLGLEDTLSVQTSAAAVIANDASPFFRTITISKGTRDGLKRDMAVVAPAGAVGRIVALGPRAAKVQVLVDRNAAAAALVDRTRAAGVVVGTGERSLLRMEYVSSAADIQPGDRVVTAGIDGIYPKGFVIGTIERVARGPGFYKEVVIRPAVDFSSLEEVLVVLTAPPSRSVNEKIE